MHVVATAGHVDHGKSTLVRLLTGMEPDRWAEERRRGMTIDLGFAWTRLASGETVAFVDVPGHERFVSNMLAGVGPVPAAMLVVAADEGWMPQTAEHVAALDALGVRHAVAVVTRCDLADPRRVLADVTERLGQTSMAGARVVPVSGLTGDGLSGLRAALSALVGGLPAPDPAAPVRLWVDRAFTIRGAGTVLTGTLGAGTLRRFDRLELAGSQDTRPVTVRELQALGQETDRLSGVARVAVNLRGVDRDDAARGDALLTPGAWTRSDLLDVELAAPAGAALEAVPAELVLHVGSAAVAAQVRPLGGAGMARLSLRRPLPMAPRDVALLRDPGRHVIVARVTVLDVAPPPFSRRGAASARSRELAGLAAGPPDGTTLLQARGVLRKQALTATGSTIPADALDAGEWLVDRDRGEQLRRELTELVAEHRRGAPLEPGPTVETARTRLGLPDREVLLALVRPPLSVRDGRLVDVTAPPPLPASIARAVSELAVALAENPFAAPDADRLRELGLGPRELAAAERAGALLRVSDTVVLAAGADLKAAQQLAGLPQPFTLSEARQRLGTSRRVAVPLLELLDRRGLTRRLPDDRRVLARSP